MAHEGFTMQFSLNIFYPIWCLSCSTSITYKIHLFWFLSCFLWFWYFVFEGKNIFCFFCFRVSFWIYGLSFISKIYCAWFLKWRFRFSKWDRYGSYLSDSISSGVVSNTQGQDTQTYRRVFVYTFCLIKICLLLSDDANKIKTLNIERA